MRHVLRQLRGLLPLGILAWLGVSGYMVHLRVQPIHFPEPVPDVDWARFAPVTLTALDGIETRAWWHEGETTRPVLLILHELGGGRGTALPPAKIAADAGCGFFTVTLRAHGESQGNHIDYGWSASADVVAAVDWVEANAPGRPVLIRGVSMGAAAAVFAAPELGGRVDGYFLECLYADLSTALWNRADNRFPPPLREVAWLGLRITAPVIMGDVKTISPARAMRAMPGHAQVWILYGEEDQLARPHESQRIAKSRTLGPVLLDGISHAGHASLYQDAPERMQELLMAFLTGTEMDAAIQ